MNTAPAVVVPPARLVVTWKLATLAEVLEAITVDGVAGAGNVRSVIGHGHRLVAGAEQRHADGSKATHNRRRAERGGRVGAAQIDRTGVIGIDVAKGVFGRERDGRRVAGRDAVRRSTHDEAIERTRADEDRAVELPLPTDVPGAVSVAVIDCDPAVSSVAATVATPPENEMLPKVAPPTESVIDTLSLNAAATLPKASSAVTESVSLAVLLAVGLPDEVLISNWLAAAALTVIALLVPVVIDGLLASWAVIVCVPLVVSVASTVAWPPLKENVLNDSPPAESVRTTLSEKLVAILPN